MGWQRSCGAVVAKQVQIIAPVLRAQAAQCPLPQVIRQHFHTDWSR